MRSVISIKRNLDKFSEVRSVVSAGLSKLTIVVNSLFNKTFPFLSFLFIKFRLLSVSRSRWFNVNGKLGHRLSEMTRKSGFE